MMPWRRITALIAMAAGFAAAWTAPACAAPEIYKYVVENPTYGHIGTYTNTITEQDGQIDIHTVLRVTVRFLGIPMFREDAQREETWHDNRLVSFRSDTDDNGKKINVTGAAEGNHFVIDAPSGTIVAPAHILPSNPCDWQMLKIDTMMSTRTGRIVHFVVTDRGWKHATFDGQTMWLHQYTIHSNKHQAVWLNAADTVVAFETEQHGHKIDFVLKSALTRTPELEARQ